MPKVEKISDNLYRYQCECGAWEVFESDTTPERLVKCFECQIPIEELFQK